MSAEKYVPERVWLYFYFNEELLCRSLEILLVKKTKLLRQQNIFSSRRKFRAFSIGDKRLSLKESGWFVTKE
ncbi:hypothetical protein HR15_07575 [Porphyromonas gulae]|uniref:Uncharacterized protein n=1 Tax=Porphyromonas gulae TaxID=111105 RepID=A0A0A2F707_9PORP|nr:hypothetical protein HR15_07575 [Porphyromonas gulae]